MELVFYNMLLWKNLINSFVLAFQLHDLQLEQQNVMENKSDIHY